jgi:hypothetical protein
MNCPVCNALAQDITPDAFDGKSFRCLSCGEFDVVRSVYEPGALKALDLSRRKDALARAQLVATIGQRPRITTYDL